MGGFSLEWTTLQRYPMPRPPMKDRYTDRLALMNLDLAQRFATSTLGHVGREYPNGLSLILNGPTEVTPSGLHPIFYGSFDWHSCVHGWWQLIRISRLYPELAPLIHRRAKKTFTKKAALGEIDYLQNNPAFERPYGWGWLLALHLEATKQDFAWEKNLALIAELISKRFKDYLPRLTYPIRAGTHANTAFALILAHDWAKYHDSELQTLIEQWARDRFANDVNAAHQEPSGEDFLSPTLVEALLMARTQPAEEFRAWVDHFMPQIPINLLHPVEVSDRSDGRIGHLDGLHLSRAWCWRNLTSLSEDALDSADLHVSAALPHLEANYMSEHWLCSFALLAMTDVPNIE